MLRISVVLLCRHSMTNSMWELSSFKNRDRTTSWGKSAPAMRVVLRLAQTVSTISSTISSKSSR